VADLGVQVEDKGSPVDKNVESKPLLLFGTQKSDTTSLKKPKQKQTKAPQPKKKTKLELLLFI